MDTHDQIQALIQRAKTASELKYGPNADPENAMAFLACGIIARDEMLVKTHTQRLEEAYGRERAVREELALVERRLINLMTAARDMLSTYREDGKSSFVSVERQEAWAAAIQEASK